MQNSMSKENVVEFTSKNTEVKSGASIPSELTNHSKPVMQETIKQAQIKPLNAQAVSVIKKDGTREAFDAQKIINAVKKSATRALVEFTEEDLKSICDFVNNNIVRMNKQEVTIAEMHNLVEGALEHLYPQVAQSYRNYRNYKQDFVHMLDKVYQESQRKLQCRFYSCFNKTFINL